VIFIDFNTIYELAANKNGLTRSDGDPRHDAGGDYEDRNSGAVDPLHGLVFTGTIITIVDKHP
jgi:hypothetical protein